LKEARAAFNKASDKLLEISQESHKLENEISRLRRTITALAAMCSESPGFDDLGITDSVMEVMETETSEVTSADVVEALSAMGFDLASHKNVQASVHAILSRLAHRGKIVKVVNEETKVISWRGPKYSDDRPF
jgi:hypothetical protein